MSPNGIVRALSGAAALYYFQLSFIQPGQTNTSRCLSTNPAIPPATITVPIPARVTSTPESGGPDACHQFTNALKRGRDLIIGQTFAAAANPQSLTLLPTTLQRARYQQAGKPV